MESNCVFPRQTEIDDAKDILSYLPLMADSSHQSCRKQAKIKVLLRLKRLSDDERREAIDKILAVFAECNDPCLQNYITDILLYQLSPDIDNKLVQIAKSSNGKIAGFVKDYILGVLKRDKWK